ncbi:restriction endonuclease-like protein [Mariniblastus sp.]|nr:restriction endonuclease-like protein [Mariniblastus sp.]
MTPFHRITFCWDDGTQVEIEWAGGREGEACPVPKLANLTRCTQELEPDSLAERGVPAICWRPEIPDFFPLQLREETEYLIDIKLPITKDEAIRQQNASKSWPLSTLGTAFTSEPTRRWSETDENVTITGRINFRAYVGIAEINVYDTHFISTEVVCAKIGYFEDFQCLMDSIADELVELLLQVESPTFSNFSVNDATESQLVTYLFLMRNVMMEANLPNAIEDILLSPRSHLSVIKELQEIEHAKDFRIPDLSSQIAQCRFDIGGPLKSIFRGLTPRSIPVRMKHESVDTPENKFVKAFLEDLVLKVESLVTALQQQNRNTAAKEATKWLKQINDWLLHALWEKVGRMSHFPSNSLILQKAVGYRDVLATDIKLQLGISFPWHSDLNQAPDIAGELRPISLLYEYWCFFFLKEILSELCGNPAQRSTTLFRKTKEGLSFVLQRGENSKCVYEYKSSDGEKAKLTLFYNRKFVRQNSSKWTGSYSATLNPDFSILIECNDKNSWLHFDAKYRLEFSQWKASFDTDVNKRDTYKQSDLFKMHTYRDALLGSRGSFILFPGADNDEEIFIRYPGVEYSNQNANMPSVGAFQAKPTGNKTQVCVLRRFLKACFERIVEAEFYQEETGFLNQKDGPV